MFDINSLSGYTYATIRSAFTSAPEICYEKGDMCHANITSILDRIIQDTGRFTERWCSDALYGMDKLRHIAEEAFVIGDREPHAFDEVIVFGLRQDGVDHAAYVMNRLMDSRRPPYDYVYPRKDYRRILAVRARAWYDRNTCSTRTDFSLRDITSFLNAISPEDLDENKKIIQTPFPGGVNPVPDGLWDRADSERIRADGYTAFHSHELTPSELKEEGAAPGTQCTAIYGEYPEGADAPGRRLPWKDMCICRVYRANGAHFTLWEDKWYSSYPEVKRMAEDAACGPLKGDMAENAFVWQDIVKIDGNLYAESAELFPDWKALRLPDIFFGRTCGEVQSALGKAAQDGFVLSELTGWMSEAFQAWLAKKLGRPIDEIGLLTCGDFAPTEEECLAVDRWPGECGLVINGIRI